MKRYLLFPVLLISALVHSTGLYGEFVFDDLAVIRWLQSGLSAEIAREFGIAHRPIPWLSYWIDYRWAGLETAFYFHLTNVAIHLACVALVFGILSAVFARHETPPVAPEPHSGAFHFAPAIGSLLFGIHPFFGSAVSYIDARASLLAAMFCLAALWCVLRFKGWKRGIGAIPFALGLLSKEESAVLIPMLLVLAIVGGARKTALGLAVAGIVGLFTISVVAPYIQTPLTTSIVWPVEAMRINGGYPGIEIGPYLRSVTSGYMLVVLRNIAAPFWLSIDPLPEFGWEWAALAAMGLTAMGMAVLDRRVPEPVRIGIGWLLCAPMLGCYAILLAEPLFEYRNYIVGLGFALLAGLAGDYCLRNRRLMAVPALAVVLLSIGTIQRNEDVWRRSETVWRDALAKGPGKERPAQNLSSDLMGQKRLKEAEAVLLDQIAIHPGFRGAHTNLAGIYMETGRVALSEEHARKGEPIALAYFYRSMLALRRLDPESAFALADKAVTLEPTMRNGWMAMHDALLLQGKVLEARGILSTMNQNAANRAVNTR